MIHQWKRALLEGAADIFELGRTKAPEVDKEVLFMEYVFTTGSFGRLSGGEG